MDNLRHSMDGVVDFFGDILLAQALAVDINVLELVTAGLQQIHSAITITASRTAINSKNRHNQAISRGSADNS